MSLKVLFVFRVKDGCLSPFQAPHLLLYSSCRLLYCYGNSYKNKNVAMSCTLNYVFPTSAKTGKKVKQ